MKSIAILFLFLGTCTAFSAPKQYIVESQIYVGGKLMSSPRVVAVLGEESEIAQVSNTSNYELRMKSVIKEAGPSYPADNIAVDLELTYVRGFRSLKLRPKLITKLGKLTRLTSEFSQDGSHYEYRVKVTPYVAKTN